MQNHRPALGVCLCMAAVAMLLPGKAHAAPEDAEEVPKAAKSTSEAATRPAEAVISTPEPAESSSKEGIPGPEGVDAIPSASEGAEYEAPERKSLILHAEAIASESRGEHERALAQLRDAYALTPNDDRVRFDLARVALLHGGAPDDLRPFHQGPKLPGPGAEVLRAAVAHQLNAEAAPAYETEPGERLVRGSVRLGITVDDNVAISPNDPQPFTSPTGSPPPAADFPEPRAGVRGVVDALVIARPLDWDLLTVEGVGGFRLGTFLNSDDGETFEQRAADGTVASSVDGPDLSTFNAQRLFLGGRVSSRVVGFLLRGSLQGDAVFADGFGTRFSQSLTLGVEALMGTADSNIGVYGDASTYNFGSDANPEDSPFDRDGETLGAGLTLSINRNGLLGFTSRLGVFNESTDGADLQVRGARLDFAVTSQVGPVSVAVGSGNQVRVYGDVSFSEIDEEALNVRVDGLIQPYARVLVGITEQIGVYGNYGYTQNLSTDDENIAPAGEGRLLIDRTYTRNFFEFGVEGRL